MHLRTRLLVPLVGLPLASVALLGAVAYWNGREALEASLGRLFEVIRERFRPRKVESVPVRPDLPRLARAIREGGA